MIAVSGAYGWPCIKPQLKTLGLFYGRSVRIEFSFPDQRCRGKPMTELEEAVQDLELEAVEQENTDDM